MWDYITRKQLVLQSHKLWSSELQLIHWFNLLLKVFSFPQSHLWRREDLNTSVSTIYTYPGLQTWTINSSNQSAPDHQETAVFSFCRNFMAVHQPPLWCSVTEPAEKCSPRGKPVFHPPAWRTPSSLCPRPPQSPSPSLSPHQGPLPAAATVEQGLRRIWSWPPSWARLCWRRTRSWRPLWSRARGRWRYRTEQAPLKNSVCTEENIKLFVKSCKVNIQGSLAFPQ